MEEYKGIQEVVNQAVIQAATVVMMALHSMDVGLHLDQTANLTKSQ